MFGHQNSLWDFTSENSHSPCRKRKTSEKTCDKEKVRFGKLSNLNQGRKRNPNPNFFFCPDIFRWGGGLSSERVGAEKFGMSLETREIFFYLAGYPGILSGYLSTSDFPEWNLAKFSAKLVANSRRSLEGEFRASFAGKIVRSIFRQNSTAVSPSNFATRFWVVVGTNIPAVPEMFEKKKFVFNFWPLIKSGVEKLTRSSLKGFLSRALFAH